MAPDIAQLVPHCGTMSLLAEVSAHGEDWLEALARVSADSPFCEHGTVGAWVGIEYMAQAIAAFSGLRAKAVGEDPHIGLLVGARSYRSRVDSFAAGAVLRVRAERRFEAANGLASFACSIHDEAEQLLAEGTLTVFQPADMAAFAVEGTP